MTEKCVLHHETEGSGPKLALVHGFTQNRRCWGGLDQDLALDHTVIRVDAPGHGRSLEVHADLDETADLLAAAVGPATWVGYSMGGRMCLSLALRHPEVVHALVLISATPGIADEDERRLRRETDNARADRIGRIGVEPFLEEWLGQPMFQGLRASAANLEARLENSAAGLAASLRLAGTGSQRPLWDELGDLTCPALVVVGARDRKFAAIGREIAVAVGNRSTLLEVADAGHAVHLERPAEVAAAIRRLTMQDAEDATGRS